MLSNNPIFIYPLQYHLMPKVIDNYVLEDKIGAGQFGDVYKGYHQETKQQVAIKTIRRQTIKGKFYELLQNQIKVLRTCDNPYVIQLYAIKKTANHFYLMLQYCNQGDMLALVRKQGTISQEKAIKYFCQILSAFQDLVKHKIMHRDFKLANILLHDDTIKIADFGFAKLLSTEDYATTMLGSPLNMAPQVLGGNKYNSKADIWSIGACLWEMLYGKPPYVASNMVDLLKMIKTKPLKFPAHPVINDVLKDVLKKMLVADSKRRISWNDLFSHKINSYLDHLKIKQINLQLPEDQSLLLNTSKYYLKNNLVVENPSQIQQNQDVNEYLLNVIKSGHKGEQYKPKQHTSPSKQQNQSSLKGVFRKNMKRIMHHRNVYVFLANVSDQIMTSDPDLGLLMNEDQNQLVAFVLVSRIIEMTEWLIKIINNPDYCPLQNIQNWQEFQSSQELAEIKDYIQKQSNVFGVFSQSLSPAIKKKYIDGDYGPEVKQLFEEKISEYTYSRYLKKYCKSLARQIVLKMLSEKKTQPFKKAIKHLEFSLIALNPEDQFGKEEFDFTQFYESYNKKSVEQILLHVQKMMIKTMQ